MLVKQSIVDKTYENSDGNLYYISVNALNKTFIAGNQKKFIGQKYDSKELDEVFKGNTKAYMVEWNRTTAYNVTVPIKQADEVISSVSVRISINNMENTIHNRIIKAITAGIVILMLVTIVGIILGERIAKTIENIEFTVN
ncbi:hypothetical protein CLPUN_40580 [Clostridium puniceum]|uniref:Uncharacterized protein n=1 Tax=Clostridium puniceum TaxID=29367 RepID=A0A1S8T9B9_9CLOT|nr:hypothetical protein [Clostridium puniceum]OOM74353.1 hypothetical protein CLPUN_40580 [Clostridium puniceum]